MADEKFLLLNRVRKDKKTLINAQLGHCWTGFSWPVFGDLGRFAPAGYRDTHPRQSARAVSNFSIYFQLAFWVATRYSFCSKQSFGAFSAMDEEFAIADPTQLLDSASDFANHPGKY